MRSGSRSAEFPKELSKCDIGDGSPCRIMCDTRDGSHCRMTLETFSLLHFAERIPRKNTLKIVNNDEVK
jgi:hypothetical protein